MLAALPIPAGPAQHETLASYLNRLASLHTLPLRELWDQLSISRPGSRRRVVLADRLAIVTDRPAEHLAWALPELRDPAPDWTQWRHQPQPGCPHCDARHDGGAVLRLLQHHHYVCTKHRYWIGPPDAGHPATRLDERLTDVVHAQHRHRRLLTRYGHAALFDAVLTGFLICAHLWADRTRCRGAARRRWTRRANVLIPPGTEIQTFSASKVFAAVYPEAVGLAAIIAAPPWRARAHGSNTQQRELLTEACRQLGMAGIDDNLGPAALIHWMRYDSHHPPSCPDKTFPDTREHHALRQAAAHPLSRDRTYRSAAWFAHHRRGGNTILYHRHLTPVIQRAWAPAMHGVTATVVASGSTTNLQGLRRVKGPVIGRDPPWPPARRQSREC